MKAGDWGGPWLTLRLELRFNKTDVSWQVIDSEELEAAEAGTFLISRNI